jgi:tetratricopeptide (TPR) repeat protein
MEMRYISLLWFLVMWLNSSPAFAQNFYSLSDIVQDGKVSSEVVDYFLDQISSHTRSWPPKWDYPGQPEEVAAQLNTIINALELARETSASNVDILWRLGLAYTYAYNLGIPGSPERANEIFQDLLFVNPDHPQGNLYYGAFLAGIAERVRESIPYLEKAARLGFDEALFMLGFVYVHLYDDNKALEYYRRYLGKHPDNEQARKLIEAIKKGTSLAIQLNPSAQ